ncbi:hypothetical protein [Modicisalibacter radicis]|uniref:hypothetical protein n=1 Tax=Halomonas sp. EAR18 TaxID=2518972 RepID=UPI00109D5738|nr:hypothetical protein [Halomonas sp. EAR18]
MPQPILLWGVVTPAGEPIVSSLDYTQYAATYRYGASCGVDPNARALFWLNQQALGYQAQQFTLIPENNNG